jgi:hypothetical protein
MQARGPATNVILTGLVSVERYCRKKLFHSRISIYALDIRDTLRKWCQPTLRFPFGRIGPPDRWVAMQIIDMDVHVCIVRYKDFVDFASIDIVNGGRKREDDISLCAGS